VLLTGLILAAPSPAQDLPQDIREEARFLPDGCQLVGVVKMKNLIESKAYKQLKAQQSIRRVERAVAHELPLPLNAIDRVVFGGIATEDGQRGVFVFRTTKDITEADVLWSKDSADPPIPEKVGNFTIQLRRSTSYILVDATTLVVGDDAVLKSVATRKGAPVFSAPLKDAIKEIGRGGATIALAIDVNDVRARQRGKAQPFIPGLDLDDAEARAENLALSLTFGDDVQLEVSAYAADALRAAELKVIAEKFSKYGMSAMKKRGEPAAVIDLFSFTPVIMGARCSISKKLPAEPLAELIELLSTSK
jgi:hypothetical protein